MRKDERYGLIKHLIESRHITQFRQIFNYLPKTVMARELSKNTSRMTDLIDRPEELKLQEVFIISELIDIHYIEIVKLIMQEISARPSRRK